MSFVMLVLFKWGHRQMMKYICKSTRIFEIVAIKINSNFHSWINLIMLIHVNYDLALHEITCTLYSFQWYSYFGVIKGVVDIFIIFTWLYFKVANIRFHLAPLQYWVAHSGRMVKNCRWCNSQVYVILLFYNMMQYPNELIQLFNISCWPKKCYTILIIVF